MKTPWNSGDFHLQGRYLEFPSTNGGFEKSCEVNIETWRLTVEAEIFEAPKWWFFV